MGIQLNLNSNMISVSSSYIGNASSLVDGNLTTQWVSYGGGSSTWIKISLNKIYDISEIKFLTEADTFYTSGCDIYISMDDIIYTKINPKNYTYTNYWADYNISSISTKFIKLTNFINSKDSYTRIYELEIFISPKYYLINDNNQYKYFNKTTFLMGNTTNNPPTANDYRNYGNEDLSYLCTSYNQEVLQMNNFTTLGGGKYGYIDCNNKFLNVSHDYDNYTKLLMHMNDNAFKDECGNTVTNNNVTLDATNKKFGNGSASFNGTNSYLSISSNNDFNFGNSNFTIDFWIYPTSYPSSGGLYTLYSKRISSSTYSGVVISLDSTGKIAIHATSNGSSWDIAGDGTTIASGVMLNAWNHIAVCRNNNSIYGFVGGVIGTSSITTTASISTNTNNVYIGGEPNNFYFKGDIDELRISNVARWTSNFTPPNYKKYLIQDNTTNTIYTYNGTTLVQTASQTLNESNFITNGFDDLTIITNSEWISIFSDLTHIRILYYTSDTTITENDLTCNINSYRPIDDLQNNFTYYLFKDNG